MQTIKKSLRKSDVISIARSKLKWFESFHHSAALFALFALQNIKFVMNKNYKDCLFLKK